MSFELTKDIICMGMPWSDDHDTALSGQVNKIQQSYVHLDKL